MPQIELRNAYGAAYRIDSSDPELLAKWLWEQVSANAWGMPADPGLQILMRPRVIEHREGCNPVMDWTPDSRLLGPWYVPMADLDTPYKRALAMIDAFTTLANQFKDPE